MENLKLIMENNKLQINQELHGIINQIRMNLDL